MSETTEVPALPDLCWPVDWACVDADWLAALDPDVKARAEAMAVSTLRALTAYKVGGCPILVRPCAAGCGTSTWLEAPVTGSDALGTRVGPWTASVVDGQWVNTSCGCRTECSCTTVPEVILAGPVGTVVQVMIDGAVLDPSAYRLDNGDRLVRVDGGDWPRCQDMAAAADAVGAFSVTYLQAAPVDGLGAWVAGIMAVEYAKACTGGKCRLPSGVQSISRQGLTMEIPSGLFADGLTGIREVDSWLRQWNPYSLRTPSRVWSPDLRRPRRQTATNGPVMLP